MVTTEHQQHLRTRVSHNDCQECRADTERQFVNLDAWRYLYVTEYLTWALPRIKAIREGDNSVGARIFLDKFRLALHRRISGRIPPERAERKRCDSYLERLKQFQRGTDAAYLRRFAARGASCLGS